MAGICVPFVLVPFLAILPIVLLTVSSPYNTLVDYVEYHPPPIPPLEGPLAPNDRLTRVTYIAKGKIDAPESITIAKDGTIYASAADGYIYRWFRGNDTLEEYAYVGGRPLGLNFDKKGNLIVADCLKGLVSIDANTRQVTVLTSQVNGSPIFFADDLEIAKSGKIYFSDASSIAPVQIGTRWISLIPSVVAIISSDPKGSLLEYDPETRKTRVLIPGLVYPNGVTLSKDESYVLVTETGKPSIHKYHISGPKAGQHEYFVENLPGIPDGISAGSDGRYYVAFFSKRSPLELLMPYPFLKKVVVSLLPFLPIMPPKIGFVAVLDTNGNFVDSYQDLSGQFVHTISDVHEKDGKLFIGSLANPWIAVYDTKNDK
jgi:sugar lactone lactonase YvrE